MSRTRFLPWISLLVAVPVLALLWRSLAPDRIDLGSDRDSSEVPIWVAVGAESSEGPAEGEEKKGPSGAMQALQYWGAQRAYPNRTIPDAEYGLAIEDVRAMRAQESSGLEENTIPWTALGPANVGGRTLCLALHPDDPDILFAGSASGGLWKSTTGGVGADAWDYIDTGYPVLGVSSIAIDATDPDVMYIGTGEAYDYDETMGGEAIRTTRGSYGVGILKTTDGGATWAPSLDWTYQQSRGVWMVQIHPTDPDILFAATTEGVFRSTDAGGSWSLVHAVIMAMDVRIHPVNPTIIFAAHGNFGSAGHGIYRTTDGGDTWQKLTSGLPTNWTGKAQLAISPLSPDTIYASIADSGFGRGLYRSTNTGTAWAVVNFTDYQSYQGWYSHYVIVSPFDADTLFTGGIEIWRSTNGGSTLEKRSRWQSIFFGTSPPEGPIGGPDYAHADHHFAVWHPTDPNTIFFASDGGVFRTTNRGNTFESLIGGYQTSQFYNGFSNSGSDPDFAMGGLQDNFTVIYQGTNAWRRVIGGDGCWTAINPLLDSTIFGSAQYLYLVRSYDAGNNWSYIEPPEQPGDYTAFVAPYVLSPDDPSVLYAGRSRVYRSASEGSTWSATNGGNPLAAGNPVMSLAVSETDADVVYAGTAPIASRARIFRSRNGGAGWDDITGILPDRYPSDLAVDPNDDDKVYATFMGFGTSHAFRSVDGGDTWIDIGGGLPDIPASAVMVDPDHPDVIYVGTDLGVFFSPDTGGSWHPFTSGMPLAMVNDLKVFLPDRKVRAATHGNGTYERDLFAPCTGADADSDGICDASDCAPGDNQSWELPGEVVLLRLDHAEGIAGTTDLSWTPPETTGAVSVAYDVLSSAVAGDFVVDPSIRCVESDDGTNTAAVDVDVPASGGFFYYLVRAENGCGHGPLGVDSLGAPRSATACP